MKHAVLSPSKSSMWLNCTPSARLGEKYAKKAGEAADEGTLAHSLSELLLKQLLEKISKVEYSRQLQKIKLNPFYSASMMEHCTQFAVWVIEKVNELQERHGETLIILEAELDLSTFIPEGFGTGDVIIIAGHELYVIDFKYGKGVFVHTKENTQMMIYALGAIELIGMMSKEIKKVEMTIYQPRLDNIDSWEIPVKTLLEWAKNTLRPLAILAFEGKGSLSAGTHCTFCACKVNCKEYAGYNLEIAKAEFDTEPHQLPDKELIKIYLRAKEFRAWLTSIEEYMLNQAINGKTWKGLKLVHGRSVREITNASKVIQALQRHKIPVSQYMSEPTLLGITALEKNIGARQIDKMVGKYIKKPEGKASLVSADSNAKDYDPYKSAKEDFSN